MSPTGHDREKGAAPRSVTRDGQSLGVTARRRADESQRLHFAHQQPTSRCRMRRAARKSLFATAGVQDAPQTLQRVHGGSSGSRRRRRAIPSESHSRCRETSRLPRGSCPCTATISAQGRGRWTPRSCRSFGTNSAVAGRRPKESRVFRTLCDATGRADLRLRPTLPDEFRVGCALGVLSLPSRCTSRTGQPAGFLPPRASEAMV